jgi:peptidoglycan/xylan/chitin deacetylase (PgdA/CDA1 family)
LRGRVRYILYRLALEGLSLSGAARFATPRTGGLGAILTLHHVRPERRGAFQPNRILEITPDFLDELLDRLARSGTEFVSLAEARARIVAGRSDRRFVCLTFDDGYRDNAAYAQPILTRYGAPWTLFVATRFADQTGEMWWLALERVIASAEQISFDLGQGIELHDCRSNAAKARCYEALYWRLRALAEPELLAAMRGLAVRYGVEMRSFARELCMGWDELKRLATDPLVTIGAHTVSHPRLATLPEADAMAEMRRSREIIAEKLGKAPTAFAYPVGDPSSAGEREFRLARTTGFDTAVTTRPGVIEPAADLLSLPRISLNGLFQKPRYVEALLSGLPFRALTMFQGARRPSASSG